MCSQKNMASMPKRIFDAVIELDGVISQRENKVALIQQEYPGNKLRTEDYNNRKKRLAVVNQDFEKAWVSSLKHLDECCKKVRLRQPHLNELCADNINSGLHYPDALAFGRLSLSYENWRGFVPRMMLFPFKRPLCLPEGDADHLLIHQLLLRIIHSMPVGSVEIIAADPLNLGTSLNPFLSLLKVSRLFPGERLLTRANEIEAALIFLTDYVESLLQIKFKGDINSWTLYNSKNKDNPLAYKLILLFGVPEQLTDKSIWCLSRLLEHGPRCGVLPVLTIDVDRLEDRKFANLQSTLKEHSTRMDSVVPSNFLAKHLKHIHISEEREFWPGRTELNDFLDLVSDKYMQSSRFSKNLYELWNNHDLWEHSSDQGVDVPIGWSADGELVSFLIGGVNTEHHVLLAGRSGSGKSNLLHVLIHSLCHFYAPSELNIYLLDYKQGTEFSAYASPPIPHAKLVATESDTEYGVTVLEHLMDVLNKRSGEFKKRSVSDFNEYRQTDPEGLPRILLIVDEFQILFSESRQVAETAEKMLTLLLRQGRAYGIHVLLATQTLKGIQSLSMGQLISQIGCRIALACGEEDSAMILGSNNWAAAQLNSPPEGIINNSNGAKSANQTFLIPFADKAIRQNHIETIVQSARQKGYGNSTKVFNGSRLPVMPDFDWFEARGCEGLNLHLGESLNFESAPLDVSLLNRASSNLFVAGYDDVLHDGLLSSILQSLHTSSGVDEIIYLNGRTVEETAAVNRHNGKTPKYFCTYNDVAEMDLLKITEELEKVKRVLVVDGLDSIKGLHSSTGVFRPIKNDEPPSQSDLFKKILEDGPAKGTFVIALADNWRRCNASCKELLSFFELRVGYCLNEDDAGTFIHTSIGKRKGLESANRAVFADRLKNRVEWFRPYVCGDVI